MSTETICSVDDCDRPVKSRDWCQTHYSRWQRDGDVRADEPVQTKYSTPSGACSIEGCDNGHEARGWCITHYLRWWNDGDAAADKPVRDYQPAVCGTYGEYVRGCRCKECAEASSQYRKSYQKRQLVELKENPDDPRHGRPFAYTCGCRCDVCKQWRRTDPKKKAGARRRRARKNNVEHEPYTLQMLLHRSGGRCGICDGQIDLDLTWPDAQSVSIDHIVPISKGGDDVPANVQPAHLSCNMSKGDRE